VKKILLFFLFTFSVTSFAFAEIIHLMDGTVFQGKVLEESDQQVTVEANNIVNTYSAKEILKIEPDPVVVPQKEENPYQVPGKKKELILRLLEANGTREGLSKIFIQTIDRVPADKRSLFSDLFRTDELMGILIPIYDRHFTEIEIKEMIQFYKSPVGQKLTQIAPAVMQETMEAAVKYIQQKVMNTPK